MSKTVDNRVVEMRFDNKQFESGVKQTLSTLDKLKNALNLKSANSGLENIDKAVKHVSLDGLISSVQTLEKRFSTLGIVGMRVIQNLTDSMMNFASKGIGFVNDAIVSGGIRRAMNIENAHFQLQALLKDEERVQAVMDDAMTSVDGTAYAYDEAAKAASMFAASGIEAGDDMLNSLRGVVGVAAMTNSEFEGIANIFTTVAGNGRLMGDQLLQLSGRGLNAASTIADFVNDVNSGVVSVNDKVLAAVKSISNGTKVTEGDIRAFVSKGKVSFDVFSAAMTNAFADSAERANETFTGAFSNMKSALARIGAGFISPLVAQNSEVIGLFNALRVKINDVKKTLVFDKELGNVNALSKTFTDSVLMMAKAASTFIENLDVNKPMAVFYNSVEAARNVLYGLWTVVKPIGEAFADVFLDFSVDDIVDLTAAIEELTSNFKLSDDASKDLHDTFEGLFSVVKLVGDVFISLVKLIVPVNKPITSLSGAILGLTGGVGRLLTSFTDWLRKSPLISKSYEVLASVVNKSMGAIADGIGHISKFVRTVKDLPIVQKSIAFIVDKFTELGRFAAPYVDKATTSAKAFAEELRRVVPEKAKEMVETLAGALMLLDEKIESIDFSHPRELLGKFIDKIKELVDILKSNDGLMTYLENMRQFFKNFRDAITIDKIFEKIDAFRSKITEFINWVKNTVGPLFSDFSLGGVAAGGAGIGMVYSFIKISKSLESLAGSIKAIPSTFGSIKDTLKAYQNELKAKAIKEIAVSIVLLAGALVVLSFADPKRIIASAVALSLTAGVLGVAFSALLESINKGKTAMDALNTLAKGMGGAAKQFAKALKWKAIGKAVQSFGVAVALIAGSMIALALMYKNDSEALYEAVKIVGIIALVLTSVMAIVTGLGQILDKGVENFSKAAKGIMTLSISLGIVVLALDKLFKMEMPDDAGVKIAILSGLMAGMGLLAVAMSALSGKLGTGKVQTGPILVIALGLMGIIKALNALFEMNLPTDYGVKIAIMAGIFASLAGLMISIGYASKLAGGALKGTATILSICVFVGTAVAALMVLSMFPGEALLKGAVALGAVLLALGGALYGAGRITDASTYKSVAAMIVVVASITASLGVLSMIPLPALAKAAGVLGAMLLALAVDFEATEKIAGDGQFKSILAMAGTVVVIAGSLAVLALYPWDQLLAAGTALGVTLLAFAGSLKIASTVEGIDLAKMGTFAAGLVSMIVITASLTQLASKPWENMLAAGASLSAVLLSMAAAFKIIDSSNPNLSSIGAFLSAAATVGLIAFAIYELSTQPWQQLLAAAASLSTVLLSMSVALGIATAVGAAAPAAIAGMLLLDTFIVTFAGILAALGAIFKSDAAKNLLGGGSSVLAQIGDAIGSFVGNIYKGLMGGVAEGIERVGESLSGFMTNAREFFDGVRDIDDSAMNGVLMLAKTILILTAADILQGITKWVTGNKMSLSAFGEELAAFGPHIKTFAESVRGISGADIETAANSALIMAEMANKLPNSGGLAAQIFGDNSLSEFGKELATFGPHLKQFADSVTGLDSAAVESAANSAKIMSEMASNLPNSGGLAALILGDNKLSDFGKELKTFGPLIADYSESVKGVDAGVVTASANAAQALAELANNLPNSGGLISLFTGDNDIKKFGEGLKSFGDSFRAYYESVESINTSKLSGVVTEVNKLVDMARGVMGVDASSLSRFAGHLESMGNMGIDKFIAAFDKATKRVNASVSKLGDGAITAMRSTFAEGKFSDIGAGTVESLIKGFDSRKDKMLNDVKAFCSSVIKQMSSGLPDKQFNTIGQNVAQALINGFNAKKNSNLTAVKQFCTSLTEQVKKGLPESTFNTIGQKVVESIGKGFTSRKSSVINPSKEISKDVVREFKNGLSERTFKEFGQNIVKSLAQGIPARQSEAIRAVKTVCNAVLNAFKSELKADQFKRIGQYAVDGLKEGIESKASEVARASRAVAKTAADSARKELDEHSPSKVMGEIGENAGLGLAGGITNALVDVTRASQSAAQAVIDPVQDSVVPLRDAMSDLSSTFNSTNTDMLVAPMLDMSTFSEDSGMEIDAFAESFYKTSAKVSKSVSRLTKDVIDIMETGLPTDTFKALGKSIVTAFLDGFNSKKVYTLMTLENFCKDTIAEMIKTLPDKTFNGIGQGIVESLIKGINEKKPSALAAIQTLANDIIEKLKKILVSTSIKPIGEAAIQYLCDGFASKKSYTLSIIQTFCNNIIEKFKEELTEERFSQIGEIISKSVGKGVTEHSEETLETVRELCDNIVTEFESTLDIESFEQMGSDIAQAVADGISSSSGEAVDAAQELCDVVKDTFDNGLDSDTFKDIGAEVGGGLVEGLKSKAGEVMDTATGIAASVAAAAGAAEKAAFKTGGGDIVEETKNVAGEMTYYIKKAAEEASKGNKKAGSDSMAGFAAGVASSAGKAANAAKDAAVRVIDATKKTLDSHSPSKVMMEIGNDTVIGLADGISNSLGMAATAGTKLAGEVINPFKSAIDSISGEINDIVIDDPTITPILNISDIKAGMSEIDEMFNKAISFGTTISKVQNASSSFTPKDKQGDDRRDDVRESEPKRTFEFNQYNYSPKALSRSDIYRQTRNQFATFEAVVEESI